MSLALNTPFERLPQQLLIISGGDSATIEFEITRDGAIYNVTGHEIWMTVKRDRSDADADAVLRLETGQGIVITSPAEGKLIATISAVESQLLTPYQTLFYDLRLRAPDLEVFSAAEGRLFIRKPTTINLD